MLFIIILKAPILVDTFFCLVSHGEKHHALIRIEIRGIWGGWNCGKSPQVEWIVVEAGDCWHGLQTGGWCLEPQTYPGQPPHLGASTHRYANRCKSVMLIGDSGHRRSGVDETMHKLFFIFMVVWVYKLLPATVSVSLTRILMRQHHGLTYRST